MQKALSPDGGEAAHLRTRLARNVDTRLRDIAKGRGCSVAVVVREAIDRVIAEADAGPPGNAA